MAEPSTVQLLAGKERLVVASAVNGKRASSGAMGFSINLTRRRQVLECGDGVREVAALP